MKVLFVCTGNIFRSMVAELCLRDYLKKENTLGIEVASAGTGAIKQQMDATVRNTLLSLGIDPSKHKQTKLSEKHFEEYDLIVAMHKNHQDFIKEHFEKEVPLFDEICYRKKSSILDNNELMPNWQDHLDEIRRYNMYTVQFIHRSMPKFVENMNNFV